MNESLHFSFFEDKLGKNASAELNRRAQQLDPNTTMFLNMYDTIKYGSDKATSPDSYLEKLVESFSFHGNDNLSAGIRLQGHFKSGQLNIGFMRSSSDVLRFPIWLTEVDVEKDPNQAKYLEEVLKEGYSQCLIQA
ncbi:1,4-alpha-glucan-branching enzyme [Parasponia andersonii]|uniref:1,4-alpha-glucan-branching enzyme n=1 Tax=Parasponia andersonii TaxID=3476 RepID=A0A2P5CXP4_PARAD|nr:1,4-alpha-glucan-branching enzyme [Parasponia andersonii]